MECTGWIGCLELLRKACTKWGMSTYLSWLRSKQVRTILSLGHEQQGWRCLSKAGRQSRESFLGLVEVRKQVVLHLCHCTLSWLVKFRTRRLSSAWGWNAAAPPNPHRNKHLFQGDLFEDFILWSHLLWRAGLQFLSKKGIMSSTLSSFQICHLYEAPSRRSWPGHLASWTDVSNRFPKVSA